MHTLRAAMVMNVLWVVLGCGGPPQNGRANESVLRNVHDSTGAGTLAALMREAAVSPDPLSVHRAIHCEIARLIVTLGENRALLLIDSTGHAVNSTIPDSIL